ncbi:glycosyltransferase family 4 protein [Sphingomonas sinipercae]|uniref:Glycosyltransferase family 4 protein n=1 Tax=Sphingomonas sinipercae TaxID=2714944 RepID=A0A6G7ZKM3_9SPHN|nr:glycosyltransferase family 1 protein [Sphingomonas sinipercae]QIL01460.1 glycosyltransferase family 4 protein [Sphingomonas sinipercae]
MNDAPLLLDVTRLVWRRWVGRHPTGIDRVCLAYLEHYGPDAQAVLHYKGFRRIIGRRSSAALFRILLEPSVRFRRALAVILARAGLAGQASRDRLYLNIGHTGLDRDGFRTWAASAAVRPIYFIHDLIPITHPQYCRAGEADKHRLRMRTVLETARGVIGNSQATLAALSDFAASEGLPNPPGIAAWLGATTLPPVRQQGVPDSPTFVILGTIEARKNHEILLRVWSRLVDRLGEKAPKLLLIGQRGWEAQAVFDQLDSDIRLRGSVEELNRCSDEELARHLAGARALLFPSKAEGFGLPLVEALGMGVPVIASDLPEFREIGQGVPTFLPADDEGAWERAILDFASDASEERAGQLGRMRDFRLHSWSDHFRQVDDWLATINE